MGVCSGVRMVLDYQCVMFGTAHLGILKAGKCALRFVTGCKSVVIFSDCTAASKTFSKVFSDANILFVNPRESTIVYPDFYVTLQ